MNPGSRTVSQIRHEAVMPHDDDWMNDQPSGTSLRWVIWMSLIAFGLVALILLSGCSGISQAEWDDLQAKHSLTLKELEAAEDERQQAKQDLLRTRNALARAEAKLREIAQYLRSRGQGGVLPW